MSYMASHVTGVVWSMLDQVNFSGTSYPYVTTQCVVARILPPDVW